MTIQATLIADSISIEGVRITTMQLRYPRFIHAEFMTHRVFSRNASSSRAIPVERMIADLRRDPAMPEYWGSNKPGMQAGAEVTQEEIEACKSNWLNTMENAIHSATQLIELGLHKQIANRILEPWAHINVVVTATDWDNFYELRCHPDAQPEMRMLAEAMQRAQEASEPNILMYDDWHLPYITAQNWADMRSKNFELDRKSLIQELIKISVARCARVSYLTHDGRPTTLQEDLELYERLVGGVPLHASPAEHQATPDSKSEYGRVLYEYEKETVMDDPANNWDHPQLHGNFTGWKQYRKILELQ